jgi:hypothetical protein
MRIFDLGGGYSVVCNTESTRYGFRHLATLCLNGQEIDKAKICYYNRTWESFEFESVLNKVIEQNKELDLKLKVLGGLDG